MTTIDRHALCQLLAKWAGVEIHEHIVPGEIDQGFVDLCYWIIQDEDGGIDDLWDPFTDANQLELVKAGLRSSKVLMAYSWDLNWHHWYLTPNKNNARIASAFDVEESTALALAIQAMEEGR